MSAKLALERYLRRQAGVKRERKEKNTKEKSSAKKFSPEKQVEKEVLSWCRERGFDVSVVESKAVFSRSAGRYLHGQTEAGFSDLVGVDATGRAIFIELKAEGKRSTLKPHQYDFLLRKIKLGAFACCVDSAVLLDQTYSSWSNLLDSPEAAKQYLLDQLPTSKKIKEVFNDEPLW